MERYHVIVRVLDGARLIDCESYECRYWAKDGKPLSSGFYIVTWPAGVDTPRFDEQACFIGPYKLHLHAQMLLQHQQADWNSADQPARQAGSPRPSSQP